MDASTLSDLFGQPLVAAAIILAAIVGAALWLFVPFAVIGTKPLLRQQRQLLTDLLAEQRRTNALLADLQTSGDAAPGEFRGVAADELQADEPTFSPGPVEVERAGSVTQRRRGSMGLTVDKTDRVL